eukprot:11552142-Heterocapsa_arctica.AAC.1
MELKTATRYMEDVCEKKRCVPFRKYTGCIGRTAQAMFSDPFTLFSDPFEPLSSYIVEDDQRFVRNLTAMARGLPHGP